MAVTESVEGVKSESNTTSNAHTTDETTTDAAVSITDNNSTPACSSPSKRVAITEPLVNGAPAAAPLPVAPDVSHAASESKTDSNTADTKSQSPKRAATNAATASTPKSASATSLAPRHGNLQPTPPYQHPYSSPHMHYYYGAHPPPPYYPYPYSPPPLPSSSPTKSATKEPTTHVEPLSTETTTGATATTTTPSRKPPNGTANATSEPSPTVASPSKPSATSPHRTSGTGIATATTPSATGQYPSSSTPTPVASPYSPWPPHAYHPYAPPPPRTTAAPASGTTAASYLHPPHHPSHLYQPPPLYGSAEAAWKGSHAAAGGTTSATPPSSPPPTAPHPTSQPPTHAPMHPSAHAPTHPPAYMWPPPPPPHAHPYPYHPPPYARPVHAPLPSTVSQPAPAATGRYHWAPPSTLSPAKPSTQPSNHAKNVPIAPRDPPGATSSAASDPHEAPVTALPGKFPSIIPRSSDYLTLAPRMRVPPRPKPEEPREGATSPTEIETNHRDEVQHMGCTCKKTRCLKLYCQCFGFKLYCGPNCRCLLCFNTEQHEKQRKLAMHTILARNPLAFDAKFKKDTPPPPPGTVATAPTTTNGSAPKPADSTDAANSTTAATTETAEATGAAAGDAKPAKAEESMATEANRVLAHRLGCKCRRSACMKKYCECYAGNVKCSSSCRCMGCKNMGPTADFRDATNAGANTISNLMRNPSSTNVAPMAMAAPHHGMYHHPPPHPYAYHYPMHHHPHHPMHQYQYMMPHHAPAPHMVPLPPPPIQAPHHAPSHVPPVPDTAAAAATTAAAAAAPLASRDVDTSGGTGGQNDAWIAAAQSLTFLKRSSPAGEHKRLGNFSMGVSPIKSRGHAKSTNLSRVPSLASSSEGTTREDAMLQLPFEATPESSRSKRAAARSNSNEDSALLMAAMAMTEFGQSPPPSSSMLSPATSLIRRFSPREDDDLTPGIALVDSAEAETQLSPRRSTRPTRVATKRDLNFDDVISTPRRKRKPKYLDD